MGRGAVASAGWAWGGGGRHCVVTIGNLYLHLFLGTADCGAQHRERKVSVRGEDSMGVEKPQAVGRLLCGLLCRRVGLFPSTSLCR